MYINVHVLLEKREPKLTLLYLNVQ
jgi:hypothetical protein